MKNVLEIINQILIFSQTPLISSLPPSSPSSYDLFSSASSHSSDSSYPLWLVQPILQVGPNRCSNGLGNQWNKINNLWISSNSGVGANPSRAFLWLREKTEKKEEIYEESTNKWAKKTFKYLEGKLPMCP